MYPVEKPFTLKILKFFIWFEGFDVHTFAFADIVKVYRIVSSNVKETLNRISHSCKNILNLTVRESSCSFMTENNMTGATDPCVYTIRHPYFTVHACTLDWQVTPVLCVLVLVRHESVDFMCQHGPGCRGRGQKEMLCRVFLLLFVLFCCFFALSPILLNPVSQFVQQLEHKSSRNEMGNLFVFFHTN